MTAIEVLHRLRGTPALFEAISEATGSEFAVQGQLRTRFEDDLVRAALSVADARQKAQGRLPESHRLWLTRVGLEQATAWEVARQRRLAEPLVYPPQRGD